MSLSPPGEVEFMKELDAAEPLVTMAGLDDLDPFVDDPVLAAQQLTVEDVFGRLMTSLKMAQWSNWTSAIGRC